MYYLNKPIITPKVIYIQPGSINNIISQMQANKYDVSKLDSLLLRMIGSPQSGWINMTTSMNTKADFLFKLTTAKAALQNVTLFLVDGMRPDAIKIADTPTLDNLMASGSYSLAASTVLPPE
jgi:UPF0755 protein